jgi:pimeloyl-ACP methyl ester carboxylesterase
MTEAADSTCPIILVHGGGHGAWCWERLLPLLGGPVLAVDLPPVSIRGGPGRNVGLEEVGHFTVEDWAATVIDAADGAGWERFVLVGHSLGGLTLAETACRAPSRVAHLVYVSASIPPVGGTVLDILPPGFIERTASGLVDEVVREIFCNDMDEEQIRFVIDHVGTEVIDVITTPVTRGGLPTTMATTFVRLLRDQALPPETQDACIGRLRAEADHVEVVEIDAGHNVMISRPDVLAEVLDRIARTAGSDGSDGQVPR